MKQTIPKYTSDRLNNIKLKSKDKEILNKFLKLCAGSCGDKKVKNVERSLLQVYDITEVSFDKWNIDILRDFLAVLNKSKYSNSTKNDTKKYLKRFLKEQYDDWNIRFKGFKDSSMKQKDEVNHQKLNPTTMIKPEEFELLIRGCDSFRWRAYVSLSYESAGRPEEILKLKWSDINFERAEVKLHSSKTRNVRVNVLKDCIIHLKQYKQEYPYPDVRANDYVFPSPRNRNKPLTLASVHSFLKRLGEQKLNRPIFPYLFRHTRLSFLMKKLSGKSYEKFSDHSIETAIKHYSHLSNEDVREEMFEKVFKIEELTKEETQKIKKLEKEVEGLKKEQKNTAENIRKLANIIEGKERYVVIEN